MRDLIRTRWAAVGAAVAITLGAGGVSLTQAALTTGEKPVYVALDAPCRLVDTRPTSPIGPKTTPIAAGDAEAYEIQVTGDSGQCTGALAVPADATAVATNVTAIAPVATATGRSFFTVYPADATRPGTSNLNFLNGAPPVPNKVDVGLSATGKIKIYNNEGTAHAAVDVFGYYIDHNHDDRYYTESEVDSALATRDNGEADVDGGNLSEAVGGPPETLATVTVQTPTSGYIIANASATLLGNGSLSAAECSITTGTSIDANATFAAYAETNQRQALTGTRGFQENKVFPLGTSDSYTINFVCRGIGGAPVIQDAQLNAIFVPDPDAFGLIFIGP